MHATLHSDDHALFARMRRTGDPAVRETAVIRYLPLSRRLASRFGRSSEPIEDLEQVAAIGLMNAVDRFDPGRGNTFASFAVTTILGELRRHFRDRTWALHVPRTLQELTLQIERARDELTASLHRQPTLAELSQHLGASEELVLQAFELSLARYAFTLERPQRDGEAEEPDVPGCLDDGFTRAEHRATLVPLLAKLTPKEAEIVFLRFGEDLTQDAIARRVGVSQMQVSRVLHRSLVRLRSAARP